MAEITSDRRREIIARPFTIMGLPARAAGALLPFPSVAVIGPEHPCLTVEFSWQALDTIVRAGKAELFPGYVITKTKGGR
jgi:hypothetical protein